MGTRLSKVTFMESPPDVPNLKGVSSVTAEDTRAEAGKKGFEIELDEELRFIRVEARNPLTDRDEPICVPMENVKSFRIAGDKNKSKKERAEEFKAEDEKKAKEK